MPIFAADLKINESEIENPQLKLMVKLRFEEIKLESKILVHLEKKVQYS